MPLKPPTRKAPVPAPAAPAQEAAAAPAPTPKPPRKPVKPAKTADAPVVKAPKKPAGAVPATQNKIPKVPALRKGLSPEIARIWDFVLAVRTVSVVRRAGGKIAITTVDDRSGVLFHEVAGVPFRHAYTQEAEVNKILAVVKKNVPREAMSVKWTRTYDMLEAAAKA